MHSTSTSPRNSLDDKSDDDLERRMVSEIKTIAPTADSGPRIAKSNRQYLRPSREQMIVLSVLLLIFAFLCVVAIVCGGGGAVASVEESVTGGDESPPPGKIVEFTVANLNNKDNLRN